MYLNIHYAHMVHCMIKLRPDLESTHEVGHFGIWFIQIRQIEVDINQLNILLNKLSPLSNSTSALLEF